MKELADKVSELIMDGKLNDAIAAIREARRSPASRVIFDTVSKYPGMTANDVAFRAGYSWGSVMRALHHELAGRVRCEMRQAPRTDGRPRTVPHWYAV